MNYAKVYFIKQCIIIIPCKPFNINQYKKNTDLKKNKKIRC